MEHPIYVYIFTLEKLKCYNFNENSCKLIESYLTNRYQSVRMDGVSSTRCELKTGVPQGSVLGPLLFLVFINNLPQSVSGRFTLFADDTTITLQGKDLDAVNARAEETMRGTEE